MLGAKMNNGNHVTCNEVIRSLDEAGAKMLYIINRPRYNVLMNSSRISIDSVPIIRDPKLIENIFIYYSLSNYNQLLSALSLNYTLFMDLGSIRNFYAHRNENTFKKVKNRFQEQGISSIIHPDDIVISSVPAYPLKKKKKWFIESENFFDLLFN